MTTSANQAINGFPTLADWGEDSHDAGEIKIDIRRLIMGIWTRRLMVLSIAGAVCAVSLLTALFLIQPSWSGRVTLLKKDQQDEFQVGRYGIPFKPQQYAFKTLLDTLMLPGTLRQAMNRSGVAIPTHRMASRIKLHTGRDSKAFTINVLWNEPGKAAEIANNLAEVFMQRNRSLRSREVETALLKYMGRQEAAREAVTLSAKILADFEQTHSISDLNTQLAVLIEKRQELAVETRGLEAEAASAQHEITRLDGAITTAPEMIVQSSYFVNPLQKNLVTLEWELVQARARYTDDNPKVIDLKLRINRIKSLIEAGKDDASPSNTYASNPVREELMIKRHESKAERHRLETRRNYLVLVLNDMDARIDELSQQKKSHSELEENRFASLQLERDLRQRVDSLKVLMQSHSGDFELLERATIPRQPEASGRKLLVAGGSFFGMLLGLGIALTFELLERRLCTSKDISLIKKFDLLLEFPRMNPNESTLVSPAKPVAPVAQLFRRMANDLEVRLSDRKTKVVGIVSLEPEAGRSSVAINLSQALVQKERQTVLVDADLRQKQQNSLVAGGLEQNMSIGLYEILANKSAMAEFKKSCDTTQSYVISSYTDQAPGTDASLRLGGSAMLQFREFLEQDNKWVLYDLPPIADDEAAFEAAVGISTVILVVRSGQTNKDKFVKLIERMDRHGMKVAAVVLTDLPDIHLA